MNRFIFFGACMISVYCSAQNRDSVTTIQHASDSVSEQTADSIAVATHNLGYLRGGFSTFLAYDHPGSELVFLVGLTIGPGIRIAQNKNFAVTLSAPITVGGGSSSTYAYLGFDAPAMMDLHIGSAAGNNKDAKAGFIAGAGLAYFYSYNLNKNTDTELRAQVSGYRYHAGVSLRAGSGGGLYNTAIIMVTYGESFEHRQSFATRGGKVFGLSLQVMIRNAFGRHH